MRSSGREPTDALFAQYRSINRALWAAVERGETTPGEVRVTRFEQFVAEADLGRPLDGSPAAADGGTVDPEAMADVFTNGLADNGQLYPGVGAVLDAVAGRSRLALVTNGLQEVQRTRIERLGLARYFEAVVISAEVGTSKPGTEIFDIAFSALDDPARDACLMIGDSLTSDIQGGTNYGIDTCWYNPDHKSSTTVPTAVVTHEIAQLAQLPPLALSGRVTSSPEA
ncbi:MAG: HAD-IA family hydrolase [Acidimicrobiales bacterium]